MSRSPGCHSSPTLDELAANLNEAIALHLEGEDLTDFDLAPDPTLIASFKLDNIADAKA